MIIKILFLLVIFTLFLFFVWLWFYKSEKPKSENIDKLAEKAFSAGDYKKVKKLLLSLPKGVLSVAAKIKLGIAFLKLREYGEAEQYFRGIVKKNSKNIEALYNLAEVYKAQGNYDKALAIYNKLVSDNPKDFDSIINAAEIDIKKGDLDTALELLERAKKLSSDNTKVLFFILKCKVQTINLEDAAEMRKMLDEFLKLEKREDLPLDFHSTVAKTYALKGDIEKSLEYAKKAVSTNAEGVDGYQMLGLIYLIKSDFEAAKNHLSLALNFQPKNKETHNIFSYVFCSQVNSCILSKCRGMYYNLVKKYLK